MTHEIMLGEYLLSIILMCILSLPELHPILGKGGGSDNDVHRKMC